MTAARIAIIEDDPVHRAIAEALLRRAGFEVAVFGTTIDFRRHLGAGGVDLVLVDWELPDESGLEFLMSLRKAGNVDLPVIFLTGREDERHVVEAFGAGADDYIIKPARPAELVARVHNALRRSGAERDAEELEFAPFKFRPRDQLLFMDGEEVKLTPREFDLVLYFFQRMGRIISREALLSQVWNVGPNVATRTVDTYVSRIRKRLGLSGESGWRIEGIYQNGYRLTRTS